EAQFGDGPRALPASAMGRRRAVVGVVLSEGRSRAGLSGAARRLRGHHAGLRGLAPRPPACRAPRASAWRGHGYDIAAPGPAARNLRRVASGADAGARDGAWACPRSDRTGARRATARRRRRESRPLGAAPVLGTPKHAGRRHACVEPARWCAGAACPRTDHQRKETVMADVKQHGSGKVESGPRVPPPISGGADDAVIVRLDRSSYAATPDQALWTAIRYATNQI